MTKTDAKQSATTAQGDKSQFVEVFTPLKIVQPLAWLGIVAVSVGVGGTLVWSIFGSVRQSVTLKGVVAHPEGLVQVFSPSTERIEKIEVKPGEKVEKGQIIARLRSLSQEERIATAESNYEITLKNNRNLINLANQRLERIRKISSDLDQVYQPLSNQAETLYKNRLITADVLAQSRKNYLENKLSLLTESSQLETIIKNLEEEIVDKRGEANLEGFNLKEKYIVESPIDGIVQDVNYIFGEYPTADVPLATIANTGEKELIVLATADSGDIDKLTIGDRVLFTPSNVERNRYGGIIGAVSNIQRRPVSAEYIVNFTGNKAIGEKLALNEHLYIVKIKLDRDSTSPTKFKWSSGSGPSLKRRPYPSLLGTTTVYYEERRPITYVLPFLRKLVGLSDNPGGN